MNFDFEDTEKRLQSIRTALLNSMTSGELEVANQYIDHAEYGLAFEHLGYFAVYANKPISKDTLEDFLILRSRMEDSAVDWEKLKSLAIKWHQP